MKGQNLLEIRNLKTYYLTTPHPTRAVDGIDLEIGKKDVVGLIGESGCGKSTVAWSIMRTLAEPGRILEGQILFDGKNLLEMTENEMRKHIRGKGISMIFQNPMTYLNPVMRVKDQITEVISLHEGGNKNEIMEKVIERLKSTRIYEPKIVANYYPHQLSAGMQQRVLIAMALASKPKLIIADEPTTALDVTTQAAILSLLGEIKENRKLSILLITHDLGIIARLCDELYVMYAGKIVEYGDVYKVFEESLHPYTQGLIRSTLSIDEFKENLVSIDGIVPDLCNPPPGCRFHIRCEYAKPICRKQEPPKVKVDQDHIAFCWLLQ